jgi:hypothetical protein
VLRELTASQADACALLMRQAETAQLALNTAYRDLTGPSEALTCMICESCAEFALAPDGRVVCMDCGATIGRWAAGRGLVT